MNAQSLAKLAIVGVKRLLGVGAFVQEQQLVRLPCKPDYRAGGDEPVNAEILGETANRPAVSKDEVSTRSERSGKIIEPLPQLRHGLPVRRLILTKPQERTGVLPLELGEPEALESAEAQLAQALVDDCVPPGEGRGLDASAEIGRPDAGKALLGQERPKVKRFLLALLREGSV